MFNSALQDIQWLESLPLTLDFDEFIFGENKVNEPLRPYLKPVAWIDEKDGIYQYPIAAVFPLPDGQLAYVEWDDKDKRYAYEKARYVIEPDAALTAKKPSGVNTLFDTEFDYKNKIKLGKTLAPEVWEPLKSAIEGLPIPDQSPNTKPLRPLYQKASIRFVEKDGIHQYPIAVAFSMPDERLVYVKWNKEEKRYLYENAHYIDNPHPALIKAQKSGEVVTFFDTDFDVSKEITLGKLLMPEEWKPLRDAAEGVPPTPDKTPSLTLV